MKDNLANIPELNLDKTEHFYVVGTKNRDGIVAGNYKADLKKGIGDSGALINTISGMSESEKAALREALGVGGDTLPAGDDTVGKILIVSADSLGAQGLSDEQITAAGVDIDTFMAGRYIALKLVHENDTYSLCPLDSMYLDGPDEVIAHFGDIPLGKRDSGWYLGSSEGGGIS